MYDIRSIVNSSFNLFRMFRLPLACRFGQKKGQSLHHSVTSAYFIFYLIWLKGSQCRNWVFWARQKSSETMPWWWCNHSNFSIRTFYIVRKCNQQNYTHTRTHTRQLHPNMFKNFRNDFAQLCFVVMMALESVHLIVRFPCAFYRSIHCYIYLTGIAFPFILIQQECKFFSAIFVFDLPFWIEYRDLVFDMCRFIFAVC